MKLPLFIAGRYLFAKKSHNVINIISAISAIGMAVGTAALIIIVSVYNGFDSIIKSSLNELDPDLLVTPSNGKYFIPDGEAFEWLYANQNISSISGSLTENVFLSYEGKQGIAKAKGVDGVFEEECALSEHIVNGRYRLHFGDVPMCAVGNGLAYRMGINPAFLAKLEIYYPQREKEISIANPRSSLKQINVRPSCIFSIANDIDNNYIFLPLESMRELLDCEDKVSSMEIRLCEGVSASTGKEIQKTLESLLGENFKVSNRIQQNESLYKMMRYEKASIFLILIFVVIIIAFNVFGSLTMLIIEKKGDINTLRCIGAQEKTIKSIFVLEGWMISLLGLACGPVIGVSFALLQQRFGFIKMPGNFLISSYPVLIKWSDILITAVSVALVGYIIAFIPPHSRLYRSQDTTDRH